MPTVGCSALVLCLLFLESPGPPQASCDGRTEHRVDQETYLGLTDRVHVYVPDIPGVGQGWRPFTVHVLMSDYRRPLLLDRAILNERDFKQILASRNDIRATAVAVPAAGSPAPVTVKNGERPETVTVRVSRVVPVSGGADHVFVVCTTQRAP